MRKPDRRAPLMTTLLMMGATGVASSQEPPVRWQRSAEPPVPPLTVFHSMQGINLPTAETLARGEFQFEISHRFVPPFSAGTDAFWGLDGPVQYRLGLGYAFTDRGFVSLARSNLQDNVDLQVKYRLYEQNNKHVPWMLGLLGGVGWNTDVADRDAFDSRNFQYYAQVVVNARVVRGVTLGVVPSYLYNPIIDDATASHTVSLGINGQVYVTGALSFLGEWVVSTEHGEYQHPVGSGGIELETGGHFFKVFATNSTSINPSQYLAGSVSPLTFDELRLGFAITRVLHF
jgi:hypothetical protein